MKPTGLWLNSPRVGLVLGARSRRETMLDFLVLFTSIGAMRPGSLRVGEHRCPRRWPRLQGLGFGKADVSNAVLEE